MRHLIILSFCLALIAACGKSEPAPTPSPSAAKDEQVPKAPPKDTAPKASDPPAAPTGPSKNAPEPKAAAASAPVDHSELLAQATKIIDGICACKDLECLREKSVENKVLGKRIEELLASTDADAKKPFEALRARAIECVKPLHSASQATAATTARGDGAPPAGEFERPITPTPEVLAKLEKDIGPVIDQICACKDHACAEAVIKANQALSDRAEMIRKAADSEGRKRLDAIQKRALACLNAIQKPKTSTPTTPEEASKLVQQLETAVKQICACQDINCVAEASKSHQDLGQRTDQVLRGSDEATKSTIVALQAKGVACMKALAPAQGGDTTAAEPAGDAATRPVDPELLKSTTQTIDTVCACKDMPCVLKAMSAVGTLNAQIVEALKTMRPEDKKLFDALETRGKACVQAIEAKNKAEGETKDKTPTP